MRTDVKLVRLGEFGLDLPSQADEENVPGDQMRRVAATWQRKGGTGHRHPACATWGPLGLMASCRWLPEKINGKVLKE